MRNSPDSLAAIRHVFDEAANHITGINCCRGCTLARQIPGLLDDIAELRANQLPEGGTWITQRRHRNAPGGPTVGDWLGCQPDEPAEECAANGCEERRVYHYASPALSVGGAS